MIRPRLALSLLLLPPRSAPRTATLQTGVDGAQYVPALAPLLAPRGTESELRDIVTRFTTDENALEPSLERRLRARHGAQRFREYYRGWQSRLRELDFDKLSQQGRIDYVLMNHSLRHSLGLLDREEKMWAESAPVAPVRERHFRAGRRASPDGNG